MALQDLTPQLRTRLSRMERAVGWFVLLAMGLLVFGFGYYMYNMAERKGWFVLKAPFFIFVESGSGLHVGDPVKLMGFDAGTITEITPMAAEQFAYNVYVQFELKAPNQGYIWTEGSHARVAASDFLGKRVIEVTKGTNGYPIYVFHPLRIINPAELSRLPGTNWLLGQEVFEHGTNLVGKPLRNVSTLPAGATAGYDRLVVMDGGEKRKYITAIWNYQEAVYEPYTNGASKYWLLCDETPALTERLEEVVSQVERSLPGVFALTNQVGAALSNVTTLASNLSTVAQEARPVVTNLGAATAQLNRPGALGEWLLPTNISAGLETTLTNASATLNTANTHLAQISQSLVMSLDNLASITSNLNVQVQANTNLLSGLSQTIIHADQFVQGLKHHWLLRSAFKEKKTNAPPEASSESLRSPKQRK